MKIEYAKRAVKVITSLDKPTKQRIRAAIEKLPAGDVRPLIGSNGTYRMRVGDWRILFSYPAHDTILIERIGPRGKSYKGV